MGRRSRAFLLSLVALGLLASCGGEGGNEGGDGGSPRAAIAAAPSETTNAGSYRASFDLTYEGFTERPLSMTGKGVVDAKKRLGRMELDMSDFVQGGGRDGEAAIVFDELVFYMRLPALAKSLPGGKPWLRLDLEALGKEKGVNLGQLSQLSQSDPSQALEYLRGASEDVREVGEEDVRGEATTHYRLTVDLDRVADEVPGQEASVRRVVELSGVKEVPTDVWIDDEGRVRRLKLLYENMRFAPDQKGDMRMTMELYDFGVDVEVAPPPREEFTDLADLIRGRATEGKGG